MSILMHIIQHKTSHTRIGHECIVHLSSIQINKGPEQSHLFVCRWIKQSHLLCVDGLSNLICSYVYRLSNLTCSYVDGISILFISFSKYYVFFLVLLYLPSIYILEYMLDTMSYLEDINERKLYLQIGFGNVILLG